MRRVIGQLALVMVAGNCCALPETVVSRPDLEVVVMGADGKPISGATVKAFHWSNPHSHFHAEHEASTGVDGRVVFAKEAKTELMFPLCMHAPAHNMSACISAPGHKSVAFELIDPDEPVKVTVPLQAGTELPCEWDVVERTSGPRRSDLGDPVDSFVELGGPAPNSTARATPSASVSQ